MRVRNVLKARELNENLLIKIWDSQPFSLTLFPEYWQSGVYHSDKKLNELLLESDKSKRKGQISGVSKEHSSVGLLCREASTWQASSVCRDFQSSF